MVCMDARDLASVLMDGPPARHPQMVTEGTRLHGRRVVVYDSTVCDWLGDLRACDDPYWRDVDADYPVLQRWPVGGQVPAGARPERAELTVSLVTEPDWYEWRRTHRRPEVREIPAYLVRVE